MYHHNNVIGSKLEGLVHLPLAKGTLEDGNGQNDRSNRLIHLQGAPEGLTVQVMV